MGEPLQPLRTERSRRWIALLLLAAGLLLLLWSVFGLLRLTITAQEPGLTSGGSATLVERCSRSLPADLAKACIEDGLRRDAAARWRLGLSAGCAVVLLVLSIRQGRTSRRARPAGRSDS